MEKILIVEDDRMMAEGVKMALQKEGYTVEIAHTLREGEALLFAKSYHLLILDITLPDGDGLAFCRKKARETDMPVLLLTAKDTEQDEILGLEAGAGDYITKPFSIGILRARVKALIKRKQQVKDVYRFGTVVLDFHKRVYQGNGREIRLSKAEQELLFMLVSHPGQTLTRDQLICNTWDSEDSVDENTLTVAIGRLRGKLGGGMIETVYGIGYRWIAGEEG